MEPLVGINWTGVIIIIAELKPSIIQLVNKVFTCLVTGEEAHGDSSCGEIKRTGSKASDGDTDGLPLTISDNSGISNCVDRQLITLS